MESGGTGAEDRSDSGPNPSRNPFDLANILGSSPFAGSLSSATGIYPPLTHMPSAFSMLEPHPMFPGAAALLPFGGLGSLREGLMSAAGPLGSALGSPPGNGADWWRAASEHASRQMTDCSGPGFYAGLNGSFRSPLFSPLFSSDISSAMVTTASDGMSSNKSSSQTTSSSKSMSSKSHKQSISSPIPKESKDSHGRKEQRSDIEKGISGNQENSSLISPVRSSGKSGTTADGTAETMLKNNPVQQLDYSLESSLLSAEAALYSASPFFFPFGAMAALSSAFGGMPFPAGSSSFYSCPTTGPAYASPYSIFPSHSSTSTSKTSVTESPLSQKSKSESRTWTPVSRLSSGTTSNTSTVNPVSPGTPHKSRSMAASPCDTGKKSSGDQKRESGGTATSVIVSRIGNSTPSAGSSARTLSISDHKMHLIGKAESIESDEKNRSQISSPHKMGELRSRMMSTPDNMSSHSRQSRNSDRHSTAGMDAFSDVAMYSPDGAIDLSIKKPRLDSPVRMSAVPSKPITPSKLSDYHRDSSGSLLVSSSQADVLSALAHSHQAYAEHQAQLLANNQMAAAAAAAAGLTDPLSFNLAAAAFLPQMYDEITGMTGLFYPPSALAAMAAASGVISNVSPSEKTKGRGRGRRRGGVSSQSSLASLSRGNRSGGGVSSRGSSLFISKMMPLSLKKPDESQEKGKAQGRGKGRRRGGKVRMLSLPVPYSESEEQRLHQEQFLQHHVESEMMQQQHSQMKAMQKMHQKKDSPSGSGSGGSGGGCAADLDACGGSTGGGSSSTGSSKTQGRRETLTSKLQHHQSKLAQALMGRDGFVTTGSSSSAVEAAAAAALLGSPLFKKTDLYVDQQQTSTEYDSSIRTDSDLDEDESSSECSTESDGESQSTQEGSEGGNSVVSSGTKRKQDNADDGPEKKRRRTILDETELHIPLEQHGWERETRIHSFTPKKIIGEVVYVTPCGKKLHSCYEVEKHLENSGIKELNRDNFTFSTKVNIGKFYELIGGETSGYRLLTNTEVLERYVMIEARKRRILVKKLHAQQREERQSEELSLKVTEARLQKKFEQQELAKRVAEMKLKKRAERQQQKEMLHRARQLKAMELQKSKEKQKILRQQEKYHRQQQLKLEKEVRSQQMNEEKEVKRQQSVVMKEQERERRRQQMLLIKAMEARKKEEEKERLKEEKKSAKKLDREKKLEQKRLELFMAREQKKPMEDMCITDGKPLPELERIPGVKLAGKAFADSLMVLEFVHNFSSALGFDSESLPTLNTLQCGLMNEDESIEDFMTFVSHLIRFVLDDPGMANPKEAVSQSGQKLAEIEVTDDNVSELMRIFIRSRNGKDDDMTDWLKVKPFQSLNPTQKAAILAYLCNELLGSKTVTGEIEKNIDGINNLRRDKWVIEGKLRKLRMLQAKRFRKVIPKGQQSGDDSNITLTGVTSFNKKDTDEEGEDSGNDSDTTSHADGAHDSDAEEDQTISSEELEAKIEKLVKQNHLREKVFNAAHKLSAVSFGQDRYRRRYWILPKCGGIFVEGLESSEPEIFEMMEEDEKTMVVSGSSEQTTAESEKPNDEMPVQPVVASEDGAVVEGNLPETVLSEEVGEKNEGDIGQPVEQLEAAVCSDGNEQRLSVDEHVSTNLSPATTVTTVSTVTVSSLCAPLTSVSPANENSQPPASSSVGDFFFGQQSDVLIENLSDIVSQTVMKSMGERSPARDVNLFAEARFVVEAKHEIKVKEEADMQHNIPELFDISSRWKLEPKPYQFRDDGFVPDNKLIIKSEVKDIEVGIDGCDDVKQNRLPFTKSENCSESNQTTDVPPNNSVLLEAKLNSVVFTKSDAVMCVESNKTESTRNVFTSVPLPLRSMPSTFTSSSTAFSTFRSIDSILQPDPKAKPNSILTSFANNSNPSSSTYFASAARTSEAAQWNINRSIQNGTWFSILPRVPCDVASVRHPPSQPPPQPPLLSPLSSDMHRVQPKLPSVAGCQSACGTPGFTIPSTYAPTTPSRLELCIDDLATLPGDMDLLFDQSSQVAPPIPSAYRRGWWKISQPEQIKQLLSCLNLRGIRERNLQKTLEKHLDYICLSSSRAKKNGTVLLTVAVVKLESSPEEESKSSTDAAVADASAASQKVPVPAPNPDDMDNWNRELQRKMEMKVLEDIESMEERVCHASLQGWKMSPRVTTNSSVELISSYEKDLKQNQRYILDAIRSRLLFLEHNIERRYLKPPLGRSTQLNLANMSTASSKDNVSSSDDDSDADEETATKELSSWRSAVASATSSAQLCLYMMQLNRCIAWEKSIMKVSCQICCCDDNEAELLLCDICDRGYHTYCVKPKIESIPDGDWYCYECISKASGDTCCVVCGRHGNRLATCEFCRRRAHIDCLDPPLARMPKKWSCNSCAVEKGKMKKKLSRAISTTSVTSTPLSSLSSTPVTSTPVKDADKELNGVEKVCEIEEKSVAAEETKSQDPEIVRVSTPGTPSSEKQAKSGKQRSEKNREKSDSKSKKLEEEDVKGRESVVSNGANASEEESSASRSVDVSICRIILQEMRKHPDAWPFLTPVNAKQFPTYRKVIRTPIDFQTMGKKLKSNTYKMPEEFAADARLVFSNCELFNEDDSSVGRAGHSMKLFFEKRWSELTCKQ